MEREGDGHGGGWVDDCMLSYSTGCEGKGAKTSKEDSLQSHLPSSIVIRQFLKLVGGASTGSEVAALLVAGTGLSHLDIADVYMKM